MLKLKSIGVVRKVDELGRFVIPSEVRRNLNIRTGDPLEIYLDGDKMVLQKYQPGCVLTGAVNDLIEYKGQKVSIQAIIEMHDNVMKNTHKRVNV